MFVLYYMLKLYLVIVYTAKGDNIPNISNLKYIPQFIKTELTYIKESKDNSWFTETFIRITAIYLFFFLLSLLLFLI